MAAENKTSIHNISVEGKTLYLCRKEVSVDKKIRSYLVYANCDEPGIGYPMILPFSETIVRPYNGQRNENVRLMSQQVLDLTYLAIKKKEVDEVVFKTKEAMAKVNKIVLELKASTTRCHFSFPKEYELETKWPLDKSSLFMAEFDSKAPLKMFSLYWCNGYGSFFQELVLSESKEIIEEIINLPFVQEQMREYFINPNSIMEFDPKLISF